MIETSIFRAITLLATVIHEQLSGNSDTRAATGNSHTRATPGNSDTRAATGNSDTRAATGNSDTRAATGISDTRAAAVARQQIHPNDDTCATIVRVWAFVPLLNVCGH